MTAPGRGEKLGDAYIKVTADASRVGPEAEAAIEKSLARILAAYDKAMAKAAKLVQDTGRELGDSLGDEVEKKAKPAAEKAAGAFADTFKKRLQAATANLPEITVGADTSDADKTIDGLRRRMEELSGKNVGVDVSAADALAEIDRIRTALAEVGGKDATADVRVNAAAASAELAKVEAEVANLDGKTANVAVDVDERGATSKLANIAAAAISLGSALAPVAIVGAAGIAGVGAAALAAAPGVGAIAAAFSGVGDTVKLLGQKQDAQAAAATANAAKQVTSANQVASAQRGLVSAEAGLANARDSAAEGAKRAALAVTKAQEDQVRTVKAAAVAVTDAQTASAAGIKTALDRQEAAERSLTHAQADQKQAQLDLTQARKDAKRQIEDLAGSIEDNALSQRQAVLDVADAQKALDAVKADPSADKTALEQAEITYAQQLRRQEELKQSGKDLAKQQADADKKGVEGSKLVVDARTKLAGADETVATARKAADDAADAVDKARIDGARKVADAKANQAKVELDGIRNVAAAEDALASQRRSSAASVESAQRGVEGAMAAVATAGAGAGTAGKAALDKINASLDKVGPATQRFAGFVTDTLQPAWKKLQDTAAAGVLPGVQAGLESVLGQQSRVTGFVDAFATSAGKLIQGTLERLSDPTWTKTFDTLQRVGVPAFEKLWHTGENIAEALAAIWTAFAPLGSDMITGIEDLSQKFLTWSEQLGGSSGFHEFTKYVKDNWPQVKQLIGDVAEFVGKVVEAGFGLSQELFPILTTLTSLISKLPVSVIAELLTLFLAYKAVDGAARGINKIADAIKGVGDRATSAKGNLSTFGSKLSGLFGGVSTDAAAAEGAIGRVGGAAGQHAVPVGRFRTALGGVSGALGGPWGIAAAGVSLAVGAVAKSMAEASATTDTWAQALINGGAAADSARAEMAKQDETNQKNHSGFMGFVNTITGYNAAQKLNTSSTEDAERAAGKLWRQMDPLQQATQKQAEWTNTLRERMLDGKSTDAEVQAAKQRLAYWTGEVAAKQGAVDSATQGATAALDTQATTLDGLTSTTADAAGAESDYYAKLDATKGALDGLSGQLMNNQGQLDLTSEKGRGAQDVLSGLKDAGNNLIDQMIAQGDTSDTVKAKDAELRDGFIKTAEQMGMSKDEAQRYADKILGIPAKRQTIIDADVAKAAEAITGIKMQVLHLPDGTTVVQADVSPAEDTLAEFLGRTRKLQLNVADGGGHGQGGTSARPVATGGYIRGPGTGTSDSIPAWLSDGEFVVNAAATRQFLPLLASLNGGLGPAALRGGMGLPGFAAGGPVLADMTVPVSMGTVGLAAAIAALEASLGGGGGGNIAAAAATAGDLPHKILTLVQSMVGGGAKFNSGYRPGDPGYHGLGWALDLGKAGVSGGNGNQFMADAAATIAAAYPRSLELIYDGLGDRSPDLKNGMPHVYDAATSAAHHNHVHWVPPSDVISKLLRYDTGGWLPHGGIGMNTSGVPEPVFTGRQWNLLEANLRPITTPTAGDPAAVAAGGATLHVDARQYYEVKDTPTAYEVGAVIGQRVVRDVRNGVATQYTGSFA